MEFLVQMGLSLSQEMRNLPVTLSEDEVSYYKRIFERFDAGKRGRINSSEISKILKNIGESVSKDQLRDLIAEVDLNKNTTIELDEFLKVSECFVDNFRCSYTAEMSKT